MLELIVAGFMGVALIFYAVTGGADFGGGMWDLLAIGRRADAQRSAIARPSAQSGRQIMSGSFLSSLFCSPDFPVPTRA
jgi:hypothetical protein